MTASLPRPTPEFAPHGNAISRWTGLSGVAVVMLGWFFPRSPTLQGLVWPCPLKAASGVPCATCGSTRVATLLAQGDLSEALLLAPLPALALLGALALGLAAAIARFTPLHPDRLVLWLVISWPGRILTSVLLVGLYAVTLWRFALTGSP